MNLTFTIILIFLLFGFVKLVLLRFIFQSEIRAAIERDPAVSNPWTIVLTYPGFHAIVYYRIARGLYRMKIPFFPRLLSQMGRFFTGIEIHPGAQIGRGFFIDHGMGVIIGETAIIGDDVTVYQQVTLGGTGKEQGKRHPTLGNRVVIGAGAKVLGNIHIGDNVLVGANAVVVRDVPESSTVVGVPGRISSSQGKRFSGINLDHTHLPDPLARSLEKLQHEIDFIEGEMKKNHPRNN